MAVQAQKTLHKTKKFQGNSNSIKTYIFFNPYPWMAFDPLDYARFPRSGVVPVSNFSGLSGLLQSL